MTTAARRTKSRVARPTWRGWLLLVSGVLALVIAYTAGRSELLALGAFLLVMPTAAWLFVRFRPIGMTAARHFSPSVIAAGRTTEVTLDIANVAGSRSPMGNWRDTWPWGPFVTIPRPIDSLAAGEPGYVTRGSAVQLTYSVVPSRRGLFTIGPLIVDFRDPFGLADGAATVEGTAQLTVTPAIVELPDGTVALAVDEGTTLLRRRRAFGGEDDLMTREYRQGDAMRRVHWRASAHHGELMVRQEEQRSHAEARILIDTLSSNYRDSHGAGDEAESEPGSESFEWAVSLCTSLSLHLADRGFTVEIAETAESQLATVDQLDEYLESLAAVRLSTQTPERVLRPRPGAGTDRSHGSVFAILAGGIAPELIDRLEAQHRSFDLAVAFIVDPAVQIGRPQPTSSTEHRLRAAGWICVAVSPDDTIEEAWQSVGVEQERMHGSR